MILKAKLLLNKTLLASSFSLCLGFAFLSGASSVCAEPVNDDDEWVSMSEGGKPAYVGLQGGTVPATVFYSEDGKEITAQVGLGSNDFLEAVHGNSDSLVADNMVPFGFTDERVASSNLAVNNPLPNILPSGVTKIYDQDFENEVLFVGMELTRI